MTGLQEILMPVRVMREYSAAGLVFSITGNLRDSLYFQGADFTVE